MLCLHPSKKVKCNAANFVLKIMAHSLRSINANDARDLSATAAPKAKQG